MIASRQIVAATRAIAEFSLSSKARGKRDAGNHQRHEQHAEVRGVLQVFGRHWDVDGGSDKGRECRTATEDSVGQQVRRVPWRRRRKNGHGSASFMLLNTPSGL